MTFTRMATRAVFIGAMGLAVSTATAFAQKWDMPMAYPATNFHSENAKDFAAPCRPARRRSASG